MSIDETLLEKRILWVDWVKCLAILAILIIHTSSSYMVANVGSTNWMIALFFESISRWGIILFIMASGFLLLRKDYDTKEFLVKRFTRVLIPFVFWNFICIAVKIAFKDPLAGNANLLTVIGYFIHGFLDPTIVTVQFWFVYMILGLYLLTPILTKWIRKATDNEILYLLGICLFFIFINTINIPFLLSDYATIFSGFVGYYVLGYFLATRKDNYPFLNKLSVIIALFAIGVIGIFVGTYFLSVPAGEFMGNFMPMGDLTIFAAMEAIAVFMFILNYTPKIKNKIVNYAAVKISIASFGIYLANVLVINMLMTLGILSTSITAISIIVAAIGVLIISYIILIIMNKIPLLKKFSTISN